MEVIKVTKRPGFEVIRARIRVSVSLRHRRV